MERLTAKNYKSFYLSFLRVAVSLWLLKEVMISWPYLDMLFGPDSFVVVKESVIRFFPGGYAFVQSHYTGIMLVYVFFLLLNLFGIGRQFTMLMIFLLAYLVQNMNPFNMTAGSSMARFVVFYLVFADCYQYFVLFRSRINWSPDEKKFINLLSNLAALSIMIQLCVAYFSAGIHKLANPLWQAGQATYYALSVERFRGTPWNLWLAKHYWLDYLTNYGALFFELAFPVGIWIKKLRKPFLVCGVIFHAFIYVFMMIYGFQVVFLLIYGMFLPNDKLLRVGKVDN